MKARAVTSTEPGIEMLCMFVFAGDKSPLRFDDLDVADKSLASAVLQSAGDMAGKEGEITVIPVSSGDPAKRILLAGLGSREDYVDDTMRHISGHIAKKAWDLELAEFAVAMPTRDDLYADTDGSTLQESESDPARTSQIIVEGANMSMYAFDKFKADDDDDNAHHKETNNLFDTENNLVSDILSTKKTGLPDLVLVCAEPEHLKRVSESIPVALAISDGNTFVRSVANLPPNRCTPKVLADVARGIARETEADREGRIKCTVISKNKLRRDGFGGITAVGQGSKNKPKLIILEYAGCYNEKDGKASPASDDDAQTRPVVLVGKAVTFDTGGISIKPGANMDEMKFDKCGGCTVLGIMRTVANLKLKTRVVGVIPAVENMPGGGSYRPGDIIRLYSGKTAEILNTDAEGRLILADAISYAEQHYSPREIIDFATLTGACIVALGTNVAGMISNDPDLANVMKGSAARTAEPVWELPLDKDYMDMIQSSVADMRNMGLGKAAGTIAAAAFLRNAICKDTSWVHLDIAGVAWTQTATKARSYKSKGATGFGLRLTVDHLLELDKNITS